MKQSLSTLETVVLRLVKLTGIDFKIESSSQGKRLVKREQSVNVSPVLSAGKLYLWLLAYEDGLKLGHELWNTWSIDI